MTTRIKYHKTGTNYTSSYILNFEGHRFLVMIRRMGTRPNFSYETLILDQNGDVIDKVTSNTSGSAKREARRLLINKYNVNLNEEVRVGG